MKDSTATQPFPRAAAETADFAGRTVVVLHAAWHSCGSYRINVAQAAVYKRLGAHVIAFALRDWPPGSQSMESPRWRDYIAHTGDMIADERFFSNPPASVFLRPDFMRDVYWPLIHGNHAASMPALVERAPIPEGLCQRRIDLIHCNHYFCIPAALKLARQSGGKILVETQDVQARQYDLRNDGLFLIPPRASYDQMLKLELDWLRRADLLVHLNEEEYHEFCGLLPDMRNTLIYPAVEAAVTGPGGADIIIVASANYPNYLSVVWFLEEILPRAGDIPVKIVGNVDAEVKSRRRDLYDRHRALFLGRVEDLDAIYGNAGLLLLPTADGHGISIKAIEALSSGAPLIATPQAFRGMQLDPHHLSNVRLCADADAFARALTDAYAQGVAANPQASGAARALSDTRRYYDALFSFDAYARALSAATASLFTA